MVAAAALVAAAFFAAACGDDSDSGEKKAVEESVRALFAAVADGDSEAGFAGLTQNGLRDVLIFNSNVEGDEAKLGIAELLGWSEFKGIQKATVSGKRATVEAILESEGGSRVDKLVLVKEGGTWKVDAYEFFGVPAKIPSGYTTVKVDMKDFAFAFDQSRVKAGKVAFEVKNSGTQLHELRLFRFDSEMDLEEALASDEEPEGIESFGYIALVPGKSSNLVLEQPLTAGRYLMLCFIENGGTPHFALGMVTDFRVK
jgi:uncharacterized cupredoxin-like copper-binding protein